MAAIAPSIIGSSEASPVLHSSETEQRKMSSLLSPCIDAAAFLPVIVAEVVFFSRSIKVLKISY